MLPYIWQKHRNKIFWYIFYHSVHWHGAFNNHRIELFKQLVCQKPNYLWVFISLWTNLRFVFFCCWKNSATLAAFVVSKCSLGISCWIMRQNMILHRLLGRNAAIISTILCFYDCLRSVYKNIDWWKLYLFLWIILSLAFKQEKGIFKLFPFWIVEVC